MAVNNGHERDAQAGETAPWVVFTTQARVPSVIPDPLEKQEAVLCICNSSILTVRWRQRQENFPETHGECVQ